MRPDRLRICYVRRTTDFPVWGLTSNEKCCEIFDKIYTTKTSLDEIKAVLKNAVLHNEVITDNRSITYTELLTAWLNSSKINTKESTYARYTHLINTHIRPYLGKRVNGDRFLDSTYT